MRITMVIAVCALAFQLALADTIPIGLEADTGSKGRVAIAQPTLEELSGNTNETAVRAEEVSSGANNAAALVSEHSEPAISQWITESVSQLVHPLAPLAFEAASDDHAPAWDGVSVVDLEEGSDFDLPDLGTPLFETVGPVAGASNAVVPGGVDERHDMVGKDLRKRNNLRRRHPRAYLDEVAILVPEPTTLLLLGCGLIGLALAGRQLKRKGSAYRQGQSR